MSRTEEQKAFALGRIKGYRAEQTSARETIRLIDEKVMRFYEATGDEPMHDVTDRRRAEMERRIEHFEEIITLWSRDLD